jgi:hypothetical protein
MVDVICDENPLLKKFVFAQYPYVFKKNVFNNFTYEPKCHLILFATAKNSIHSRAVDQMAMGVKSFPIYAHTLLCLIQFTLQG